MLLEETKAFFGSRIVEDYVSAFDQVQDFFVHDPYRASSWKSRREWLFQHPLPHREQLAEGLRVYNLSLENHQAVMLNIEKLKQEDSFVVIGGQQAGVLTGPLYVIYKAITLIKLAKQQEQETGKPVVPVFWIASEDHDYDEVNHVYVSAWEEAVEKLQLEFSAPQRASIAHLSIGSDSFEKMIHDFFSRLPDSTYQSNLKEKLLEVSNSVSKMNDFFAKIMAWLFGEYGLVLVDSADPFVRELEKPVFASFIKNDISKELAQVQERLLSRGFHSQLNIQEELAHFFVYEEGERQLMVRKGGCFQAKNGGKLYEPEELLRLLDDSPCSFSANVVSRPIMQEWLFPVLAFVGGPGEIAYWAQLKPAFEKMNMQMPIVFPRMSFTIMERDVQKHMESFQLTLKDVYEHWEEKRKVWIAEQISVDWQQTFKDLKIGLQEVYMPFLDQLIQNEPGVRNLGEANWKRIMSHVEFLQRKTEEAIEIRHQSSLKHWEQIRQALYPMEKPQERVYNVFGYLNKYGQSFIRDLMNQHISFKPVHILIYI